MIRKILCRECGAKALNMHPEDAAAGWKQRMVYGFAYKPEKHQIVFKSGDSLDTMKVDQVIDLPNLVCDHCNAPLMDGTAVVAKTMWREDTEPPEWEPEYMTWRREELCFRPAFL